MNCPYDKMQISISFASVLIKKNKKRVISRSDITLFLFLDFFATDDKHGANRRKDLMIASSF